MGPSELRQQRALDEDDWHIRDIQSRSEGFAAFLQISKPWTLISPILAFLAGYLAMLGRMQPCLETAILGSAAILLAAISINTLDDLVDFH